MNTAPTNLVIPRVFIVSWEQEADAAKPTRRECGCDCAWKEYVWPYTFVAEEDYVFLHLPHDVCHMRIASRGDPMHTHVLLRVSGFV